MTTTQTDAAGLVPDAPCRIGARGVSRSFGAVRANVDVTLHVMPGTVHAVVGENGAGKSTLMRILYGLDQPDTGTVLVDGEPVTLGGPRDAIRLRVGLVQQELAIIPGLSLLENLVLGDEPRSAGRVDFARAAERAEELARTAGVRIDWAADAAHTSIAIQQQVEILRLLYRGADVLILDEPTAVLAPAQAEELLRLLGQLRDQGRTVVFISHKLDEVVAVADEITVLRSGRTVARHRRGTVDRDGLAALVVGDGELAADERRPGTPGAVVLEASGLEADDDRGVRRLHGVTLTVRAGEVLGVAAVAGNGQEELAEVLVGVRRAKAGSLHLTRDGRTHDLTRADVRRRRRAGLAYVSADRKHEGLSVGLSLVDNVLATPDVTTLGRAGWLRRSAVRARVRDVLDRAAVRFGSPQDAAATLSGGNQQRVVVGRETLGRPAVLVASQPTRGVDVRGIGYIHELLRRSRDEGAAVVLFSEEIEELRALSDRVLVMYGGAVVGELPGDAPRARIGALMLGTEHPRQEQP